MAQPNLTAPVRKAGATGPVTIFLCCHQLVQALTAFAALLDDIEDDFILISGSSDATLPRQTDARLPPFGPAEKQLVARIHDHPHLLRWYAENLDEAGHARLSPLPLGMILRDGVPPEGIVVPDVPPLARRPLRVFCAHRHRDGPQWAPRRHVSALAEGPWRDFCTVAAQEMPEPDFLAQIRKHAFVLCVEGGGLDPSPKAWSALLHGAVPVIRNTAVAQAYAHLPVVVVDDWTADALSPARLAQWRAALLPWFDDPFARHEILHRLSLDYWWRIIAAARPVGAHGGLTPLPALYAASGAARARA